MAWFDAVFAALYDPFLAWGERAGMRALRQQVLTDVRGRTLEIGAGSGLNLGCYPHGPDSVTFTEPDPAMLTRFRRRAGSQGTAPVAVRASAERLPFADDTFDTVVSTLVLCTVPDPVTALQEIDRVLAPGGVLLLVEHVRSDDPRVARRQDLVHGVWRAVAGGCHCNRDTRAGLDRAGFATNALEARRWRRMPFVVAPLIAGPARRTG